MRVNSRGSLALSIERYCVPLAGGSCFQQGEHRGMTIPNTSRIEYLNLREVWPHEERSFTPWLLKHPDILAECLGVELELTASEVPIGDFYLDLIGTNLTDGTTLIVENQIERTDHSHLGQLITYAGGIGPSTIVWIASEFREEHRTALDWLNSSTADSTLFFGIEANAVRIDDSKPAPLLKLVVAPNDWTLTGRNIAQTEGLGPKSSLRYEFWTFFLSQYRHSSPLYRRKKAPSSPWLIVPTGLTGTWIGLVIQDNIFVDLVCGSKDSEQNIARLTYLEENRLEIEAAVGHKVEFEISEGRSKTIGKIIIRGAGELEHRDSWPDLAKWLHEMALCFSEIPKTTAFQKLREI